MERMKEIKRKKEWKRKERAVLREIMRWKRASYFLSVIINRDTCSCRVVKSLLFGHFLYPRCNHAQGQLCPTSKRGATARIYYGMSLKQTTYIFSNHFHNASKHVFIFIACTCIWYCILNWRDNNFDFFFTFIIFVLAY